MGKKSCGKINHKRTVVDGITFHSKMESRYYSVLKELKANGEINSFELQVAFELQAAFVISDGKVLIKGTKEYNKAKKEKAKNYPAICYIADFKVTDNNGKEFIIDTKGVSTPDFEIKKKWFNFNYPIYGGLKVIIEHKGEWVNFYAWRIEKNKRKAAKAKDKK